MPPFAEDRENVLEMKLKAPEEAEEEEEDDDDDEKEKEKEDDDKKEKEDEGENDKDEKNDKEEKEKKDENECKEYRQQGSSHSQFYRWTQSAAESDPVSSGRVRCSCIYCTAYACRFYRGIVYPA